MYAREKLYKTVHRGDDGANLRDLLRFYFYFVGSFFFETATFVWRILKFHFHHFFITRLKK